jgi:pimeloyl-ACP methyl ester carboxylesterase
MEHSFDCLTLSPQGDPTQQTHKIAYIVWMPTPEQPSKGRSLLAVHGLTRNSRDFDAIGKALAKEGYCVIAVDMPGRWKSDRLPAANYSYPQYIYDAKSLIAHLGLKKIDWLGTSMGGLIGMLLAAQDELPFEVDKLVINDIGPFVPASALRRLGSYVGKASKFRSMEEVSAYVKSVAQAFGCNTEEEWQQITQYYVKPIAGGGEFAYEVHYDPAIASVFPNSDGQYKDIDLWAYWERCKCNSLLLLRGEESDILPKSVAEEMKKKANFPMRIQEFPGVGHAPALLNNEQIGIIRDFLLHNP